MTAFNHTNGQSTEAAEMFWNWFVNNEQRFRELDLDDSEKALAFLDELISQMRPFNASLKALAGPYSGNRFELIITADGDVALFCKVDELIEKAPKLDKWVFTALKPALGFDDISIDMYEKNFSTDTISFFPIVHDEYPDEVGIVLTHSEYNEEEDDQFQAGGMIFLENGLGEENTATKIDYYETGALPPADSGVEVIPISKLADYLNWREKEFVEKYESVLERPEESFNLLEAEDDDGKLMMVTVDSGFKEWPQRPAFPWLLQIDINYAGDANGLPSQQQLDDLQEIEEEIIRLFSAAPTIWYIGNRTYDNMRNVYFYASEYKQNSKILHRFIESVKIDYMVLFFIRKDKYWQNMEMYFNVNPED